MVAPVVEDLTVLRCPRGSTTNPAAQIMAIHSPVEMLTHRPRTMITAL